MQSRHTTYTSENRSVNTHEFLHAKNDAKTSFLLQLWGHQVRKWAPKNRTLQWIIYSCNQLYWIRKKTSNKNLCWNFNLAKINNEFCLLLASTHLLPLSFPQVSYVSQPKRPCLRAHVVIMRLRSTKPCCLRVVKAWVVKGHRHSTEINPMARLIFHKFHKL